MNGLILNVAKKRREFRKAKTMHISQCNNRSREVRQQTFKVYKRTISEHFRLYNAKLQEKLRLMRSKNPSDYWKLINGVCSQKHDVMDKVCRDVFVNHFEKLGNISEDQLFDSFENDHQVSFIDKELNKDITTEEILMCIRKLKNKKACGLDMIINEFLKASCPVLLETLALLFNLILNTGKIPTEWSMGYITPIYKGKGDPAQPDNYRGITVLSCFGKHLYQCYQ